MKKTFILILLAFCLVFAFTFTACNDNGENTVPGDGNSRPSETSNYSDRNSRVYREYENENLRNIELVSAIVNNWDSYKTVFVGYPIWWGIAAWPINNFIKNNDFTGKTIIPFATSASSGLGQSGALLAQMAGTGNWQEGMRFSSGASRSTVTEWVTTLNLTA